ncbi:PASTA domain-containing protein [Sphingosinicellaceae bacterium]|nr:PASTA domain-containing protein [Sphingosinicellaceae bacterium]
MLGARLLIAACLALLAGAPGAAASRYDAERTTRVSPAIAAGRATVPPPSAPRQFTVGDVSTQELRASFQTYVARTCGLRLFRVSTRYVASNLERGAMVGPSVPAYGQTVGCGRGVLVQLSEGPSSPPDRQPPRETPPVIIDTYTPPREQPLLVDNFRNINRIPRFEARVAQKCGSGFSVSRLQRPSSRPPGQYDGQQPDPETVYECGMPVTVWTAAAREVPDLLVGDLSVDGGHALAQQVARKCDQELQIDNQERHAPSDPGAFVSQSPPPATVYRCGMGVTIVRSLGQVEAWLMPELRGKADVVRLEADARDRCQGHGLAVAASNEPSDRPRGTVLSQDPQAGTRINCATRITLTVAVPQESPVSVIYVGNLDTEAGIDTLQHAADGCPGGLTVARTSRESTLPVGAFDGQTPSPATVFTCGMAVTAWTSRGPAPPPIPSLPDLVDHDLAAVTDWANAVAKACGHAPAIGVTHEVSQTQSPGTVLKQTPAAGDFACSDRLDVTVAVAGPSDVGPGNDKNTGTGTGTGTGGIWPYIVAALAVAAVAGGALWWFLTPRLVFGVPRFGGSTEAEGLAGALPLIALEARAGTAEVSEPALPIDKVETDDGR